MGTASASYDSADCTCCLTLLKDLQPKPPPASPAFALRASAFRLRQGYGGQVAKATADKTAGGLLRIRVERFNPALRLYERLGFRQIDDRGVYLFMEWVDDNSQRPNDPTIQGKRFDKMGVPTGLWDGFHPSGRTASLGSLDRWIVGS